MSTEKLDIRRGIKEDLCNGYSLYEKTQASCTNNNYTDRHKEERKEIMTEKRDVRHNKK